MKATSLTMTDAEYDFVKNNGLFFIRVFRQGLKEYRRQTEKIMEGTQQAENKIKKNLDNTIL